MATANADYALLLAELDLEVQAQMELPLRVLAAGDLTISAAADELTKNKNDWVALVGLDDWDPECWRTLDIDRNAWERSGPILLCLGPKAVNALAANAPNVKSYTGAFHVVAPEDSGMSKDEVEQRLNELHTSYALTHEAVIRMAEAGELPSGAHFVEWLILLDRGDLV